jgi:hypothetical protein
VLPGVPVINYGTAQTRADNAIIALGASGGDVSVRCDQSSGTVQFILDVAVYFFR